MPLRVVFHCVAAAHDFLAQFCMLPCALADAKEGGFGCVLIEQIQYVRSNHRIGAIIDGDGDLIMGVCGQSRPV